MSVAERLFSSVINSDSNFMLSALQFAADRPHHFKPTVRLHCSANGIPVLSCSRPALAGPPERPRDKLRRDIVGSNLSATFVAEVESYGHDLTVARVHDISALIGLIADWPFSSRQVAWGMGLLHCF